MSYYVMSTQYSDAFGKPNVAKYDNNKWAISGDAPTGFKGEVKDLSHLTLAIEGEELQPTDVTITQMVTLIDTMREEQPTGRLLIIPQWVGRWLYENHEAFKPSTVEG